MCPLFWIFQSLIYFLVWLSSLNHVFLQLLMCSFQIRFLKQNFRIKHSNEFGTKMYIFWNINAKTEWIYHNFSATERNWIIVVQVLTIVTIFCACLERTKKYCIYRMFQKFQYHYKHKFESKRHRVVRKLWR